MSAPSLAGKAGLFLALLLLAAPLPAIDLADRAGLWNWSAWRDDAAWAAQVAKHVEHGHNFTALACFDHPDGIYSPKCHTEGLARLVASRVRQLNETGIIPLVYVFNAWQEPWQFEWWRDHTGRLSREDKRWVRTLAEATAGLDLVWATCLEPHEEQAGWIERVRKRIREVDSRPIANDYRKAGAGSGYDHYESGTYGVLGANAWRIDYINGDHHQRWLKEKDPAAQVALIDTVQESDGVLMVTQMHLAGRDQCLPGWRAGWCAVADWDSDAVWARMGEEAGSTQPTPGAMLRCIMDRLGWKWDQRVPKLPGSRKRYVNNPANQQAEARLIEGLGVCP